MNWRREPNAEERAASRVVLGTLKNLDPKIASVRYHGTPQVGWRQEPDQRERAASRILVGTLEELTIEAVWTEFDFGTAGPAPNDAKMVKMHFILAASFGHFYSVRYMRSPGRNPDPYCIGTSSPNWFVCQDRSP